jgi:hypothetical protein
MCEVEMREKFGIPVLTLGTAAMTVPPPYHSGPASERPINLLQLREVDVSAVPFLNCADIPTQGVRGDLEAPNWALAEIVHEVISVDGVPSANVVRENHLALAVGRKPPAATRN